MILTNSIMIHCHRLTFPPLFLIIRHTQVRDDVLHGHRAAAAGSQREGEATVTGADTKTGATTDRHGQPYVLFDLLWHFEMCISSKSSSKCNSLLSENVNLCFVRLQGVAGR